MRSCTSSQLTVSACLLPHSSTVKAINLYFFIQWCAANVTVRPFNTHLTEKTPPETLSLLRTCHTARTQRLMFARKKRLLHIVSVCLQRREEIPAPHKVSLPAIMSLQSTFILSSVSRKKDRTHEHYTLIISYPICVFDVIYSFSHLFSLPLAFQFQRLSLEFSHRLSSLMYLPEANSIPLPLTAVKKLLSFSCKYNSMIIRS